MHEHGLCASLGCSVFVEAPLECHRYSNTISARSPLSQSLKYCALLSLLDCAVQGHLRPWILSAAHCCSPSLCEVSECKGSFTFTTCLTVQLINVSPPFSHVQHNLHLYLMLWGVLHASFVSSLSILPLRNEHAGRSDRGLREVCSDRLICGTHVKNARRAGSNGNACIYQPTSRPCLACRL